MQTDNATTDSQKVWGQIPSLNEERWQGWVEKGIMRDRRKYAFRLKVVKGVSIAMLLAGAAAPSRVTAYELVLHSVVTVGALFVMWQMQQAQSLAFAVMFVVIASLYNPVFPLIHYFGGWQGLTMVASTIPFGLSFARVIAGDPVKKWNTQ